MEDCLPALADVHVTTHFVKLHHEIAEMDHITAPAFIAYRNGDVFATVVDVLKQIPNSTGCSVRSLEDLLMQCVPLAITVYYHHTDLLLYRHKVL